MERKLIDSFSKELKEENTDKNSYTRWINKKVINKENLFIPNINKMKDISVNSNGSYRINEEVLFNNNLSLEIKPNNFDENKLKRFSLETIIKFKEIKIRKYNRISLWINIKAIGFQNFYFHFQLGENGETHTASVEINKWQRIIWEFDIDENLTVDKIKIIPFLFGVPAEAIPDVSIFINQIDIEEVEPDYILGWNTDNRIAYCHSGYYTNGAKTAITQNVKDVKFDLINEKNEIVYTNNCDYKKTELGDFYILNFTNYNQQGKYKIRVDENETEYFIINDNPYYDSLIKSLNFLRLLRCGESIDGVHSACHLNSKSYDEKGNSVPTFGGWHDAGDVSQFEICTAEITNALLDLSFKVDDELLKQRILVEARVGVEWLLRTRFKDGSRALAVGYSIWRDNELDINDTIIHNNKAEKGPFESFCSSASLAIASRCYDDKIFSDWCLRVAKEDFEYARNWYKQGVYTKRWGKSIDSQVCGQGLVAAAELYVCTQDSYYINVAIEYSKIIMQCQETNYILYKTIRGFFYEDIDHKFVLSYEHRGHEQCPIQGLCRILQVYPNIKNNEDIKKSIIMYEEYIINTIHYTYPYYLLPANIYNVNKVNLDHITYSKDIYSENQVKEILNKQITNGIHINDDWYLRIFPIAIQRRGFHATLLSKTKAVSMIAKTFNNQTFKEISIRQLEWVLGKNPFSSSTMYGEGNNYHPLYVAFSKQMVGSLPVGIKTKGDLDLPYWPTINNAVYKEIWGHTTAKFLWILADIM